MQRNLSSILLLAAATLLASCGGSSASQATSNKKTVIKTVLLGQDSGPKFSNFTGDMIEKKANHPFPVDLTVEGVVKPNHKSQDALNKDVINFYEQWKLNYLNNYKGTDICYIEGDFTGGEPDGWPKNVRGISQSEATGYGMIVFALMAGYDEYANTYFNGLVKLYETNQSIFNNKNMSWIIPNVYDPNMTKSDSASDGDLDIAYALILADKQWGSGGDNPDYIGMAKGMMKEGILGFDISKSTNRVLMGDFAKGQKGGPGKVFKDRFNETCTRPSDWLLDHFRLFASVLPNARWDATIKEIYTLIDAIQDKNTGLLPDFAEDVNGKPQKALLDIEYKDEQGKTKLKFLESEHDEDYGWNACRIPWRLATDYAHYKNDKTKAALDRLNAWSTSKISTDPKQWPSKIWHGYNMDGTKIDAGDDWSWALAFTAPIVAALITDPSKQEFLNSGWDFISNKFLGDQKEEEGWSGYYSDTIALLNMLLISGNWWSPEHPPTSK